MESKYLHTESVHNLTAPQEIVPVIMNLLKPDSVIDIGCGVGTFLYCFKKEGVKEVLGVDGSWVNKELLSKYLTADEFVEMDLEKEFRLQKQYDLVLSLEVAEHISENSADIFIKNLISSGNVVLFSAAISLQGGQNHINEQPLSYWEEKFLVYDYILHDVLRPLFWDNPKVLWWYKQNMVLFAPRSLRLLPDMQRVAIRNIVHYELYQSTAAAKNELFDKMTALNKGQMPFLLYVKHMAIAIFGYNNINKIIKVFK